MVPVIDVRKEGGYYSVFASGVLVVAQESVSVAERVASFIRCLGLADSSECAEVARSISCDFSD